MKDNSTENHLELLPAEMEQMFPSPSEVVVFSSSSRLPADLVPYLAKNGLKARVCDLQKPVGKYGQVQKSGEIFVLPLLISYFHDPNINQVLCSLMAAYVYDLVTKAKKTVRGAIGEWREPERILSIQNYHCTETKDGVQTTIGSIWTNCYSPKEIADVLRRSQETQQEDKEDIMVGIVQAIIVGIEPLGSTDISDLTQAEILDRLRKFFFLSIDEQRTKLRATIPLVRVFSPDISSPAFQDDSFLSVAVPTDLYDQIYRAVGRLRLPGRGDNEHFHIIAVAITP